MKSLLLTTLFLLPAFADDPVAHERSAALPGARFEIVQSTLAAKYTYRLDRVGGRVWQLVVSPGEDSHQLWQEMAVMKLPDVRSTAPRFQIFMSGLAAKFTYLLDSVAGTVWQIVVDEHGFNSWQLMPIDP